MAAARMAGAGPSGKVSKTEDRHRALHAGPSGKGDGKHRRMSSEEKGNGGDEPLRFEAPRQRGMLLVRALVGYAGSMILCVISSIASLQGVEVGALVGFAGAFCFGMMGMLSWRRSRASRPPLVVDEKGVAVDNGLGTRWRLPWEQIESVTIGRSLLRRRVELILRDQPGASVSIPLSCHVDAPVEWIAGLIETFRQRALHRDPA